MAWHTQVSGGYALGSQESIDNAVQIYNVLSGFGFGYNAICAVLGNIGYESGYNPWRWQSDYIVSTTQTSYINTSSGHAYGLLQFDTAGRYINNTTARGYPEYGPNFANQTGSQFDGIAQLKFLNNIDCQPYPGNGAYIPTAAYPETYAQFKVSNANMNYLTAAWEYNYERGTWDYQRVTHAQYWFDNLLGYLDQFPIWLLFKFNDWKKGW